MKTLLLALLLPSVVIADDLAALRASMSEEQIQFWVSRNALPHTYRIKSAGVTVTDELPGVTPDDLVGLDASMSEEQFQFWANRKNAERLAVVQGRHAAYLAANPPLHASVTAGSQSQISRVGGGLGAGGFGGAGGYAGYGNTIGMVGFGGGGSSQGNAMQSSGDFETKSYDMTYPDLDDDGGGPLTIINPYCRDWWLRQLAR